MKVQPGYKKKTKSISTDRNSTGFINKNQAENLIKEYISQEEFYEIEPAIVLKCYVDDQASDFPTRTLDNNTKIADYSMLGAVRVRLLHSQKDGEYLDTLIRPLSSHIVQYPLRGETVNIANYNGVLYYSNPLNQFGLVNMNRGLKAMADGTVMYSYTKYNRPVAVQLGDTVVQGRYGQSIHFGSDQNHIKPYMKITVGQNDVPPKEKVSWEHYPHVEKINIDEASIHIMTNQHIPLKTASPSKVKAMQLGGFDESAIAINADSMALNSKKESVSLFANKYANISANTGINLETEFGKIYLGDVDTMNTVVKSQELKKTLNVLVTALITFANKIFPKGEQSSDQNETINNIIKALTEIKEQDLMPESDASFASKRVFIANELDEDNKEKGNSTWDNFPWEDFPAEPEYEEIEDVETIYYETEKITAAAGVRG